MEKGITVGNFFFWDSTRVRVLRHKAALTANLFSTHLITAAFKLMIP